ncbi:MAG: hypothetical protein ACK4WH_14565 [Phycisphaerales bacterium]
MELDLADAVETAADPAVVWRRMLEPSAVMGILGGEGKVLGAAESAGFGAAGGHTIRIKGVGGGLYHARIDRCDEPSMVSYVVWREDVPDSLLLLTYTIETAGSRTMLTGSVTMDMPLEELLGSFLLAGVLALPLVGRRVRRYVSRRLRTQLLMMAAPAGEGVGGGAGS